MDIGSGKEYPSNALSNFSPHPFVFDGVECNSMEGSKANYFYRICLIDIYLHKF